MTNTLFIRLLNQSDKERPWPGGSPRCEGRADEDVMPVNPESFRQVRPTPPSVTG